MKKNEQYFLATEGLHKFPVVLYSPMCGK